MVRVRTAAWMLALAAVFAACGSDPESSTSSTSTASTAPTTIETITTSVTSEDVELNVEVTGPPDPRTHLVAVHGGPGRGLQSAHPYRALADEDRAVVLFDQRGAGASTPSPDNDYSIEAQVRDLEAVRAATGSEQIDLLGESFGAIIAAAYAAEHPDRVEHLVLVSPAELDPEALRQSGQRMNDRIAELQAEGLIPDPLPPNDGDSCLPVVVALAAAYVHDPRNIDDIDRSPCSVSTGAMTQQQLLDSPAIDDIQRRLGELRAPVLLVSGESDGFGLGSLDHYEALLASATVERVVVPDAGHSILVERAEQLVGIIDEVLR